MTGFGSSWKLSGGSMLSASVTKVSKKRQVRRAISRNDFISTADIARLPASVGARLTQRAIAGEKNQAMRMGRATGSVSGPAYQTKTAAAQATARLPAIWAKKLHQSVRRNSCDCAAVVHSSRRRWLTKSRNKVRTIASIIPQV